MQQARNAASWLDEIGVAPRHLIHDRDSKYPGRFGAFWKTEGVRCLRIPPRAPIANAFCECFIGKLKRECLDHFLCFSRGQLHHILTTWLRHWSPGLRSTNTRRPHQGFGMENKVLDETFEPRTVGPVRCKQELGGIIKSYYREAA
jgi:putative transposase